MKKVLKKLFDYLFEDHMEKLLNEIDNVAREIDDANTAISTNNALISNVLNSMGDISIDYSYINSDRNDLQAIYDEYLVRLHKESLCSIMFEYTDFISAVMLYDKMLYKSTEIIFDNSVSLLTHITMLEELRKIILGFMFDFTNDPQHKMPDWDNFYLYYVDCSRFTSIVKTIPIIDIEKMFMIEKTSSNTNSFDKYSFECAPLVHKGKYIMMDYSRTGDIRIVSPNGIKYIESKYGKSIIRVMYSIYMNKMYLYRVFEADSFNK